MKTRFTAQKKILVTTIAAVSSKGNWKHFRSQLEPLAVMLRDAGVEWSED